MSGERFNSPVIYYTDINGDPLAGGKLYFYENETTTPKETYADVDLTIPNPHPIYLDGAGRLFVDTFFQNSSYRVELRDSSDVIQWTKDDVNNIVTSSSTGNLPFPGMVVGFYGTQAQLDVFLANQWFVMDGNNGTPNTDELFIKATTNIGGVGLTGGSEFITPTGTVENHVLTVDQIPPHNHGIAFVGTTIGGGPADLSVGTGNNATSTSTGGGQAHDHNLTMDQFDNQPSHIQWIWVIYLGV